jgi:hypothetical protein
LGKFYGLPYLDGLVGIYAPKQAVQLDAIRVDRRVDRKAYALACSFRGGHIVGTRYSAGKRLASPKIVSRNNTRDDR